MIECNLYNNSFLIIAETGNYLISRTRHGISQNNAENNNNLHNQTLLDKLTCTHRNCNVKMLLAQHRICNVNSGGFEGPSICAQRHVNSTTPFVFHYIEEQLWVDQRDFIQNRFLPFFLSTLKIYSTLWSFNVILPQGECKSGRLVFTTDCRFSFLTQPSSY